MWSARAATTTTSTTWSPAGPRGPGWPASPPAPGSGPALSDLGVGGTVVSPAFGEVLEGRDPAVGTLAAHIDGDQECGRLRPHLLRTEVGEPPPPAGPGRDRRPGRCRPPRRRGRGRRLPPTGRARSPPHPGRTGHPAADHRTGGRRVRPPDQPGPRSPSPHPSGRGQRGPRAWTAGGRPWTAGGCSPTPMRPGPSITPASAWSCATVSVRRGTCPAREWGTWSVSTRHCADSSRNGRRPWTSTWPDAVAKRNGPGRTRGAFHATRPDKDRTCTVDSLMGEWKQRAADYGFDLGDLTRVVGRGRSVEPAGIDPDRVRSGLEELSGRRRTLAHRDVVAVLAAASPQGHPLRGHRVGRHQRGAGRRCPASVPVRRPPQYRWAADRGRSSRGWATLDVVRVAGTSCPWSWSDAGHRPGAVRAGPRHGPAVRRARPGPQSVRRAAGSVTATDTAQRSMPDRSIADLSTRWSGSGKASPRSGPARLRSVRHRVRHGSRA